jgi:hypothetical protein
MARVSASLVVALMHCGLVNLAVSHVPASLMLSVAIVEDDTALAHSQLMIVDYQTPCRRQYDHVMAGEATHDSDPNFVLYLACFLLSPPFPGHSHSHCAQTTTLLMVSHHHSFLVLD